MVLSPVSAYEVVSTEVVAIGVQVNPLRECSTLNPVSFVDVEDHVRSISLLPTGVSTRLKGADGINPDVVEAVAEVVVP